MKSYALIQYANLNITCHFRRPLINFYSLHLFRNIRFRLWNKVSVILRFKNDRQNSETSDKVSCEYMFVVGRSALTHGHRTKQRALSCYLLARLENFFSEACKCNCNIRWWYRNNSRSEDASHHSSVIPPFLSTMCSLKRKRQTKEMRCKMLVKNRASSKYFSNNISCR